MDLRSAARGFLAFLLSVPVLQGNDEWTVTYSSSNVCALRGAMVEINCTYEYPDDVKYRPTTITTLWFTKEDNHQPVDLEHDTDSTGRVESSCGEVSCTGSRCHGTCTLRIKDLRQSDSAVYKFRFTTNQPGGEYTGDPGVTLSVTDLQVKVSFPDPTNPTGAELECHSMCGLAGDPRYIWLRNGQNVGQGVNYSPSIQSEESYSCAVEGYEHLHSPVVYAPKTPSVTVSPSGEIKEGSSVTLSCSSEANPAADYIWFKDITDRYSRHMNEGPKLIISYIWSLDSGQYRCDATNKLGKKSVTKSIDVKYAPNTPSVTVTPSGEIEEGSRVTLSCSSDANPAAEYTWFKVNADRSSTKMNQGPLLVFSYIVSSDSGQYCCEAQNTIGKRYVHNTIDVKYGPEHTFLSSSPSGEIKEGSSVTLSCSSDANPAAEYTWFKNNQPLLWGPRQPHTFHSVRPEDRGTYRCHAENKYGHLSSNSMFLNVTYAPKTPSVTVSPSGEIEEGSSVTLSCSSDANPAADYTWFRVNRDGSSRKMNQGPQLVFSYIVSSDSGQYRCEAQNTIGKRYVYNSIDVKYAPKTPSVTVSPSGEVEEGSSVTLSCSSDANPAAEYTWFKVDRDGSSRKMYQGPQLVSSYILSSDSGQYRCDATNKLGKKSVTKSIDVKYAPKTPSVTVRPSGEIEEGSSVTLSCSSDANPAAKYIWFKVDRDGSSRKMYQGPQLVFSYILSSDSGQYRCEAQNTIGKRYVHNSIDVKYGPKHTFLSSSPSGEIEEGSSVTLSCSSEANPAAEYTWFKEHEDSVKASGQNYSIIITSELGGNYYCQAHNAIGHHNSTLSSVNVKERSSSSSSSSPPSPSVITAATLGAVLVFLATVLFLIFLWLRRRRASRNARDQGGRPDTTEEGEPREQQYSFINFPRSETQEVPPHQSAGSHVQSHPTEQVLYSAVQFQRSNAVAEDCDQTESGETSEMYSTVQKKTSV